MTSCVSNVGGRQISKDDEERLMQGRKLEVDKATWDLIQVFDFDYVIL